MLGGEIASAAITAASLIPIPGRMPGDRPRVGSSEISPLSALEFVFDLNPERGVGVRIDDFSEHSEHAGNREEIGHVQPIVGT